MSEKTINQVVKILEDLSQDTTIPKNVKLKLQDIISTLNEKSDLSIKVNKALNDLGEIADDTNIEQYVRTQIWSAVSLLEKIA